MHNLGTIYYPVSLLVLTLLCWNDVLPRWAGGVGILILAWGDGLAAVIGERNGGRRLIHGKTLGGSVVMFVASAVVTGTMLAVFVPEMTAAALLSVALGTALLAAAVELVTPLGLDNLTVPLVSAAAAAWLAG